MVLKKGKKMEEINLFEFFEYAIIFHIVIYSLSSILIIFLKDWATNLHAKIFGIKNNDDLKLAIYKILGIYKILIIVFFVVPYLAMLFAS